MTTGEPSVPRLVVLEDVASRAARLAIGARPHETGGVLLGWYEGDSIIVADLLEIADPTAGHVDYVRNHGRAQAALRSYLQNPPNSSTGYVGEWHSHPMLAPPSNTDYESLRGVVEAGGQAAAMLVLATDESDAVRVWGVIGARKGHGVATHDVTTTLRRDRARSR